MASGSSTFNITTKGRKHKPRGGQKDLNYILHECNVTICGYTDFSFLAGCTLYDVRQGRSNVAVNP